MEPPGDGVMTNDASTATNQNLLRKSLIQLILQR
jgi:hypothetical protein